MVYSKKEAEEILREAPQELAEFIWKGLRRDEERKRTKEVEIW
jgi:hypothetical protein